MNQNFDPQQNYDDQQYQSVQQSYVPQQGYGYQQSPPYLYGNHYKAPLREPGTKRDMIFAGVFFLLSILCVNFTLYGGQGISLAIGAMGIYGAGLVYLLPRNRGNRVYLGFCILTYMLCCFSLLLTDSTFGKLLILDAMVLLAGITVMEIWGRLRPQTYII